MINISKIRKKMGIKQYELAFKTGMSIQGINYLEKNDILKANFGNILRVAKVLDIDLNKLKEEIKTYDKVEV